MNRVLLLLATGALILTGCQKNAEPAASTPEQEPYTTLDQMDRGATTGNAAASDRRTDAAMTDYRADAADPTRAEPAPAATDEPLAPAGARRTYVVKRGDTLFSIARQRYNDPSRWRDIWNANRDKIPNKDRLPVGTELVLP